jgi:flagellar biogenesis protein FliO
MEVNAKPPSMSVALFHSGWWKQIWNWLSTLRVRRIPHQLRLCESLSLGEKRLIAVIQYEGQRFLVGAGAQSVNLLSRLDTSADFSQVLTEWCERQR